MEIITVAFAIYILWVVVTLIMIYHKLKTLGALPDIPSYWFSGLVWLVWLYYGPSFVLFTNKYDKFKKDKGLMALIWQVRISYVLAIIWGYLFYNMGISIF